MITRCPWVGEQPIYIDYHDKEWGKSESEEKIACPECKTGHLISRRGRQGKIFYGCDNFPKCKFSLPTKPYSVPCPTCHFPLSLLKGEDGEKQIFQCANKTCRHIFEQ